MQLMTRAQRVACATACLKAANEFVRNPRWTPEMSKRAEAAIDEIHKLADVERDLGNMSEFTGSYLLECAEQLLKGESDEREDE